MSNPSISTSTQFGSSVDPGTLIIPTVTLADVNGNLVRTSDDGTGTGFSYLGGASTLYLLPTASYGTTPTSSGTFGTAGITYGAYDISINSFTGGTTPSIRVYLERQGADGNWYLICDTGSQTVSPQTISIDISPGLNSGASFSPPATSTVQHNVFSSSARVRWTFGGSPAPTAVNFSVSMIGR